MTWLHSSGWLAAVAFGVAWILAMYRHAILERCLIGALMADGVARYAADVAYELPVVDRSTIHLRMAQLEERGLLVSEQEDLSSEALASGQLPRRRYRIKRRG